MQSPSSMYYDMTQTRYIIDIQQVKSLFDVFLADIPLFADRINILSHLNSANKDMTKQDIRRNYHFSHNGVGYIVTILYLYTKNIKFFR